MERNFFETSGSAYLDGFVAKLKTKPKECPLQLHGCLRESVP
jgi:hypothetical protein